MKGQKSAVVFIVQAFCWYAFALSPARIWGDDILENAKKEGQVVFYGSMEIQNSQRLCSVFEKKYPFIKCNAIRIGSERMATRLVSEAQAGKVRADVVHQSGFDFYGGLQKGIFESYNSPERSAFAAEYRDDKGYWTINSATLNVIGYNTRMVSSVEIPKSFWDLTDPKWKGKIIMDENESKWMAGMMNYFGEAKTMELMRRLAGQDIQFRTGHSLIQTLVAAGERAIAGVAFANGVERLKSEGAPINWIGVEPIIGLTFGFALVKGSPHSNAGKLFIDFVLSREGQQVIADANYYSPRKDVRSPIMKDVPQHVKVIPLPLEMAKRYNDYFQMYRKIMRLK